MTTVTAQQRRAILANAHAAYFGSKRTQQDASNLQIALTQNQIITKPITSVHMDSTSIVIVLSDETLELDAYGNILRGE